VADNLIPISDEQAKAIQEALKTLQRFGGFVADTLGTVPQDVIGLLGGDWIKVRRAVLAAARIRSFPAQGERRAVPR
jgi:hypothetical protein